MTERKPSNTVVFHNINEVYAYVGDGVYQILIVTVCCLATFSIGIQELILYFLAFDPGWRCTETSSSCPYNRTIHNSDALYKSRCDMNRSDWTYAASNKFSIVTEFGLYCEKEYWIETSSTIFYFGNLSGAFILGWMSDRFGRSKVALFSSASVLLMSFCASFVKQFWLFETMRFLTGVTISGTYMVMCVLISEVTSERFRAGAGQCLWFFYPSGIALSSYIAYALQDWRKLLVYTSAPGFVSLILLCFLPESFIWLYAHNKEEKLVKEIRRIAKLNKKQIPPSIVFKWKEEVTKVEPLGAQMKLFLTPRRMLLTTLCLMFAWFAMGLIYFGIALAADDLTGDVYRDFSILSLMDIPSCMLAILLSSRVGRKVTIIVTLLVGSLCIVAVGFVPFTSPHTADYWESASTVRLSLGIAGKLLTTIAFDVIITWCLELYPTKVRSSANGLFNSVSIIGSICSPWVGIWLRHINDSVPFFMMGGLGAVASLLLVWLPETKGRHLPQGLAERTSRVKPADEENNNRCQSIESVTEYIT